MDFLVALNQMVQSEIGYVIRMEPGVQTCEQTLTACAPVPAAIRPGCWCRSCAILGLAARFVSGYLIQLVADVKPLEGPAGPAADFTDLHAWAEVYLPGAGWVGFDPTSGLLAGEGHIPLACTPDAEQRRAHLRAARPLQHRVPPRDDGASEFTNLLASPSPTRTNNGRAIERLGHQVDADLHAGDVRLTMGGEPTFVSLDDVDGAEWTTAALGPAKRQRAVELLGRLRQHFAPAGLLHFGQGKWYPGEPLPRWAFGCYWRKDGVPIWEDASLIAEDGKDYGYTAEHARQFLEALTRRLQVDPGFQHRSLRRRFLLSVEGAQASGQCRSAGLPSSKIRSNARAWRAFSNRARPDDRLRPSVAPHRRAVRERCAGPASPGFWPPNKCSGSRRFAHGIPAAARIASLDQAGRCALFLRTGSICKAHAPATHAGARSDLFERPYVPDPAAAEERHAAPPRQGESAAWIARPALCIQPREGKLFIFMPPVEYLRDYLDLTAAIEDTAAYLKMPVAWKATRLLRSANSPCSK